VVASGFLQHMVRALVGALVEVGLGKLSTAAFNEAFQAADRKHGHWMAPPHGLTLMHVTYSADAFIDNDSALLIANDSSTMTQTIQTVETERFQ
jgi:tRNA U38,U39,U40 pseudouridine synthase TruA